MDLVSSIRKTGSRGGVNFNWEDVATSTHRENYLGHSLKAPVGRWQKGRDLNWYAKGDAADSLSNETAEERAARERKEELRKIKEAEEDALARALGLPVAPRNATGENTVHVGESRLVPQLGPSLDVGVPKSDENSRTSSKHHGDSERRHRHRHRSRSRDSDRSRDRDRYRDRERDRRRDKSPRDGYETYQHRSRDDRDDRRGHYRRSYHSRDRDARGAGTSHRRDRNRSRSIDESERRQAHSDGHVSASTDRMRTKSPQRHRRRNPERD